MIAHSSLPLGHTTWSTYFDQALFRNKCKQKHKQASKYRILGAYISSIIRPSDRCTHVEVSIMSLDQQRFMFVRHQQSTCERSRTKRYTLVRGGSTYCLNIHRKSIHRIRPLDKEICRDQILDPPSQSITNSIQSITKNRSFHNPSRGRSIRQGGRLGDSNTIRR